MNENARIILLQRTIIIWCYFVVTVVCIGRDEQTTLLQTEQGTINGTTLMSRNGRKIYAYLKVPFAERPIGKLRLRAPVAASKWTGIRDGTKDGPICPQKVADQIVGNEDCLYLNVYVPERSISSEKLLPVMIFIYGGGFLNGECSSDLYGPQYLLDKDVILVVPNYRLGRLGFLTLEDTVLPGNWAMKDQLMAMKWVQQYIRHYGGNPDSVTIFGESAGGVSTSLHLIVPASKGLFHRAITESGSALNYAALSHPGQLRNKALFFINRVGCSRETSEETLSCLQLLSTEDFFLNAVFESYNEFVHLPFSRGVVREPENTENAFLTSNPYLLLRKQFHTPWLNGINSAEGSFLSSPLYNRARVLLPLLDAFYSYFFPLILGYTYTTGEVSSSEVSRSVYNYYFNGKYITFSFDNFTQMLTDRGWLQPLIDSITSYTGPKYVYYYDYVNKDRTYAINFGSTDVDGAAHADELISLFYSNRVQSEQLIETDLTISERMIDFWTNFATYGNPNGEKYPSVWDAVSSDDVEYLHITRTGNLKMKSRLNNYDAYNFWNSFKFIKDF